MLHVFCSPARYVQGRDATRALPAELERLGLSGRAMILASPSARSLLENVWAETFAASGLDHVVQGFSGECSSREIAICRDAARRAAFKARRGA